MKRWLNLMGIVVSIALLSGCATAPLGPTVAVMPAPGKPLEVFKQESDECKAWAFQQIGGQNAVDEAQKRAVTHAAVGTIVGTAVGAAIGGGVGHAVSGAAIGAGAGLGVGAASGANGSALSTAQLQRLYDNAYAQCMYAKGNQVPGMQEGAPPR